MEKVSSHKNFVEGMEDLIPAVNDSSYRRVIVIGDVHGCFDKLINLWQKLEVTDSDKIILLGDYVDRGAQVAEMFKWLLEHKDKPNFVFLRGNHEQMFSDVFNKRLDKITWLFNGGKTTLQGLIKLKAEDRSYIERVLTFIENLPLYHSMTIGGRQFVFVHAGIDSHVPLEKQSAETLIWSRNFDYDGSSVVVNGHSPVQAFSIFGVQDNPRPVLFNGNRLFMDTGSYLRNGKISAVDILSGEYWTSDLTLL